MGGLKGDNMGKGTIIPRCTFDDLFTIYYKKRMDFLMWVIPREKCELDSSGHVVSEWLFIALKKINKQRFTHRAQEESRRERPTEELLPEEVLPEEVLPEEVLPEEVLPEEVLPEEVLLEEVLSEEVLPEEVLLEEVLPEEVLSEEVLPEEVLPEEVLPQLDCGSRRNDRDRVPTRVRHRLVHRRLDGTLWPFAMDTCVPSPNGSGQPWNLLPASSDSVRMCRLNFVSFVRELARSKIRFSTRQTRVLLPSERRPSSDANLDTMNFDQPWTGFRLSLQSLQKVSPNLNGISYVTLHTHTRGK
uniref:uncharacterized protein n=1 Tax=Myxine glutinosa TaxID=7769 RepID=UPI00358F5904